MPRHRTLRAVVEWSWELLTLAERLLAERLILGLQLDVGGRITLTRLVQPGPAPSVAPGPESVYRPRASSGVGRVAPELTVAELVVVLLRRAIRWTAAVPAAMDSPEYSRTVAPTSAARRDPFRRS